MSLWDRTDPGPGSGETFGDTFRVPGTLAPDRNTLERLGGSVSCTERAYPGRVSTPDPKDGPGPLESQAMGSAILFTSPLFRSAGSPVSHLRIHVLHRSGT
jgi:hypothetical protein